MEKELKIGNYILGNYTDYSDIEDVEKQEICKVLSLDSVGVNEYPIWVESESASVDRYDSFEPIPLSVDWLKKANYKQLKRIEKTYSLGSFEDNSAIYFTGVRFIHINTGTQLDYVHEIQNLYYCLFKKELKFI